jgi:hypothetical protein
MHQKALVVGIAAAGCVLANSNHPGEENIGVPKELNVIEARSDGTYTYDPTHIPKWASTVAPEKVCAHAPTTPVYLLTCSTVIRPAVRYAHPGNFHPSESFVYINDRSSSNCYPRVFQERSEI